MVLETIATAFLEWGTGTIASIILDNANSQLNKNDIDKALKRSIKAAEEATKKQLFFKYNDKQIRSFLNDYFQDQVLEQLRNPLLKKSIDLDFLEFTFKQTIENNPDKYNKIQQNYIKPWLEVFKQEYLKQIGTYLKYQYAKADYFEQLANRYDDVQFVGMNVRGQEIDKAKKLLKIFVMQDVKEEKKERYNRLRETAFLMSEHNINSRQKELFRQQRETLDLGSYGENSFSAKNLLTKNQAKKVVLLGAPGSGKTTLMSYFSVAITENKPDLLGLNPSIDWLPIFIRMRDYIRYDNLGILDYYYQFCHKSLSVKPLHDGFFEHWLETGRTLILLDGLDEIVDEGKRSEIVKNIENFIASYDQNRVIITSRPAGYRRDFFDTETFPHYWLQPFDDDKINQFIDNWYDSRTFDADDPKSRKDYIKKALDNNPRIKLLARNPLLLTIIALIDRYQAQLPKERYKLYESAIQTLLTTWDTTNKQLENHTKLEYLKRDDWDELMQNLAYWIHSYQEGIKGNELEGTLIDKDELITFLADYIKPSKKISLHYAQKEAQRFLDFIRDRSGLLNEQGTDCYAFVHKTFQEYLCAQKIQREMEEDSYNFEIILDEIHNHLHDAHWREVLLLLVAQQKKKSAAKAIRSILNGNSEYEEWLHRDLLFAGSCLAENPKGLKDADESLVTEILERLVSLEISELKINSLREELSKVFCSLYETDFADQCLELLEAENNKIKESRLLKYRAELGEQATVIDELIRQLSDQNLSDGVRRSAASALGKLGKDSEEVISALLTAFSDHSLSDGVRGSAASALGRLGKDSEEVISALLTAFSDQSQSDGMRWYAAYALGNLGKDSDEVISALLTALSDQSQSDGVRGSAAYALGNLGKDSEEVISALLTALSDQSLSDYVRGSTVFALGNLGKDLPEVIDALLNALSDKSEWVRGLTVHALGNLGKDSPEVTDALLNVLSDKSESEIVRGHAALKFVILEKDSQQVIDVLFKTLSYESGLVRGFAASALGYLGKDSPEVTDALLNALSYEREDVRWFAIFVLRDLCKTSNHVLPLVVQWIETHEDSEFVGNGIEVLWRLVA